MITYILNSNNGYGYIGNVEYDMSKIFDVSYINSDYAYKSYQKHLINNYGCYEAHSMKLNIITKL